jgi:hypothetical protein
MQHSPDWLTQACQQNSSALLCFCDMMIVLVLWIPAVVVSAVHLQTLLATAGSSIASGSLQ